MMMKKKNQQKKKKKKKKKKKDREKQHNINNYKKRNKFDYTPEKNGNLLVYSILSVRGIYYVMLYCYII